MNAPWVGLWPVIVTWPVVCDCTVYFIFLRFDFDIRMSQATFRNHPWVKS